MWPFNRNKEHKHKFDSYDNRSCNHWHKVNSFVIHVVGKDKYCITICKTRDCNAYRLNDYAYEMDVNNECSKINLDMNTFDVMREMKSQLFRKKEAYYTLKDQKINECEVLQLVLNQLKPNNKDHEFCAGCGMKS